MGDEGASPEAKRNIAAYFISSSPTGEVDEVVSDVKKLVADDEVLSEEFMLKALRDYNVEQLVSGPDPDGNLLLVSAHGQVADDLFTDPATGRVLRFDHRKRKFTEVTDKKVVLDEKVAGFRSSIEKEIKAYVDGSYKSNKAVSAVYGADSGQITICISAANVHLGNFWTGGWRAVYQLNVLSQGNVEMKGDVKIGVHYFEDGNVQLNSKFPTKATVQISDEKKTGAAVAKAVKQLETDFQSNLEQMYIEMHSHTFKAMRRFLPVSKQPMNWNVAAHKMAGELASGQSG
jgi:capping protein alpha